MPRILSTALGLIALAVIEGASSTEPLPPAVSTFASLAFVPLAAFSLSWLGARQSRRSTSFSARDRARRIVVVATTIVFVTAAIQGRWWDLCLTWCPPQVPAIHRVVAALPLVASLAVTRPLIPGLAALSWRPVAILGVPYLVATGLLDLTWYAPRLEEAIALDPFLALLALALLLASLLAAAPRLLGWMWRFDSLPTGAVREQLNAIARAANVRIADVRVWRTDIPNACVIGLWPRNRFVYLTQGLLDRLTRDEVSAVHAHELGHVRAGHLWVLLAWLCSWLLLLLALDPWLGPATGWLRTISYVAIALLGTLGFTAMSRHFEHEADLWAAKLTSPATFMSTLSKVSDPARESAGAVWRRHPAPRNRLELIASSHDPERSALFERRTRRLATLVCSLAVLMGGAFAWSSAALSQERLEREIGRADYLVSSADRRIFRRGEIGSRERSMLIRATAIFEKAQSELATVPKESGKREAVLRQLATLYHALGDTSNTSRIRAMLE